MINNRTCIVTQIPMGITVGQKGGWLATTQQFDFVVYSLYHIMADTPAMMPG
ncbi:hypothetical protein X975_03946, partial [Stegodyphus mimosarum]